MIVAALTTLLRTLPWLTRMPLKSTRSSIPARCEQDLQRLCELLDVLGDAYGPGTAAFNPTGALSAVARGARTIPQAVRNYDGLEVRLTKISEQRLLWNVQLHLEPPWGNYTGLTTTDQIDGGATGRNSPDTTRSFDEPFYYFNYNGKSDDGPLPTDRPSTFKGYVYYTLPWKGRSNTTTFGLFQVAYQGSPISSWPTWAYGRDPRFTLTSIGRGQ